MSSTRHAAPLRPFSQERYMSSPEYSELRGISGNAVTAKAALMAHPAKRSLLFFLQAMSLKQGGLKNFCRHFAATFPDRIGSPTMLRHGMKPGQKYDSKTAWQIFGELDREESLRVAGRVALLNDPEDSENLIPSTADQFLRMCQRNLSKLEGFIVELCINPKLQFAAPGESQTSIQAERVALEENFPEVHRSDLGLRNESAYDKAEFPGFRNIIGALFDYKKQYEETARREFVLTEIGRQTFETLDVGLLTGKMVVVEGNSGIGKTTATEAWCNQHLGEARLVSLSGITHKTGFFRSLARVLGIGGSYAKSSTEMQTRIEDMLQRSRLVLVIDEAHHLFNAAERVYSRPELVDWLNTACYNHNVPSALICTPQFTVRMARVERQTQWNADQFRRRVKRFCTLPAKPRTQDLEAVARKLLPAATTPAIQFIVGYALSSKLNMPAIVDAIDEARLLAGREGREKVTFEDVQTAITEYCAKSSEAMARSFAPEVIGKRPSRKRPLPSAEPEMETDREGLPLHRPASAGAKRNLTGLVPVGKTTPGRRQTSVLDTEPADA